MEEVTQQQQVDALIYSILNHNQVLVAKLAGKRVEHSSQLVQQLLPLAEAGEVLSSRCQGEVQREVDALGGLPFAVLGRQAVSQADGAGKAWRASGLGV